MSLLMDALKRAEASKQEAARQQAGKETSAGDEGLSLEPLARDTAGAGQLPDLAAHLDAVDAELASSAQTPAPPPSPQPEPPVAYATAASGQAMARNSFAAKQRPAASNRSWLWLALGGLALAGLTIGAYVWYQMNSLNTGGLAGAGQPLPTSTNGTPYTPPVPVGGTSSLAGLPPIGAVPPTAAPLPPAATSLPPATLLSAEPPSRSALRSPATQPIRVTRTQPRVDPDLVQAHARLQAGDLPGASQFFTQVLQRDPNQTDALLALATIAQHQGRLGEAESWRQRALVADPSDPAVQAATLASRAAGGDAQAAESRLKTLLAAQPQSAELNFALGNLYARQQRWAEAQQHYFNAVAAEPDNPDYLFNLAVSLDQLRQPRPAAQHYRLALEAATRRPASFDGEQVRRRLAALLPDTPP
ncbi:tetratricopeptide repeat protein [Azonexus sp.]|jgi:tetratricopeptide (TPR) repeat protein|uniref:tetratricopeptide repeat protein n=1 Tax=Azonexus sp. TaxID=1872668 RepID=UPI002831B5C6|nr:tetratricopeptide repeat protein [Azonexus sp.]MDR1996294.1 tetratricopeptide repeat protein [Azonexus sp.]